MSKKNDNAAIYNVLAFTFAGKDGADENLKAIKKAGALDGYFIIAQAVVEQDEKGKVHIHEPGHGGVGATVGAVAGGLLGLIGGPAGILAWVVGGGVIGGVAGKYLGRPIAKGDLKELGEKLSPDTSALLLLLEDMESEAVINSMEGYSAEVVTLTVGDELSGQIASYMAGVAMDDQGNVIAGETAVAADAEGNVVAAADMVAGTVEADEADAESKDA